MLHQPRFCYKNLFPCYISVEKHIICVTRSSFSTDFLNVRWHLFLVVKRLKVWSLNSIFASRINVNAKE